MLRSSISPLLWRSAARLAPRAPAFSSSAAPMSTAFSSSSTPAQAAEGSILSRRSSTLIISVRDEPARTVTGFGHILTATPETSDVFEEGSPLRMGDSFLLRYYPFSSDPVLKERYLNPYGRIRLRKIRHDVDGFAGSVAYTHCPPHLLTSTPASADSEAAPSAANPSATIVTAAVNQIMLLNQIRAERDMRMTGS
ncbi:hypothetical protein H696_01996 [Fonticula alba]|uniref:Uncharacterized protein n=1 Tax=Fonticula alba TaxID=691883 RepID=A0A058ZC84_FONAL|nr:hypothetical protein H696_01996 [Fonticula alba]KCV71047.1 hypothetical protein H696_01996 [Fonticula alba]|eukprot:XP_009494170.1 hypothetical protein H696_01996 [Fonticula alba]